MRKILFFLIFTASIFGQSYPVRELFFGDVFPTQAETGVYLNSLSTPLSLEQVKKIDLLVKQLKDSVGTPLTTKLYTLWVYDNESQEASLKNLIQRKYDCTAVNTPVWGDTGYVGAISKYINTNFNPVAEKCDSNNFSLGAYSKGSVINGTTYVFIGISNIATFLGWVQAGTKYGGGIATTAGNYAPFNVAPSYAAGLGVVTTNGNRSQNFYINGVATSPPATADLYFNPYPIFVLAGNFNSVPTNEAVGINIKVAFVGKGLSAEDVRKINNCIEYYLDSRGHGVIP